MSEFLYPPHGANQRRSIEMNVCAACTVQCSITDKTLGNGSPRPSRQSGVLVGCPSHGSRRRGDPRCAGTASIGNPAAPSLRPRGPCPPPADRGLHAPAPPGVNMTETTTEIRH
jgi:hypothetical protein